MTTRSPEHPTQTTGAHRAHRRAPRTPPQEPSGRYEPYLDGLFTYCLSVLCDHDAATAALGDVLALAEKRSSRAPEKAADRRAWLYALARWSCLRRLAEAKRRRQGAHVAGRTAPGGGAVKTAAAEEPDGERQRQLALLAWPEAAGTTPEQREALELAVRHGLSAGEVAAVLGLEADAARELLAAAACEVERTRAALAVVETGTCPSVARLTGDNQVFLGAALRRELVRHVDDCPRCRRTAERAGAAAWPGTAAAPVAPGALPVVPAPRSAVPGAMAQAPRARAHVPRFDRRGFPMDPKDHAARRDRIRARAVTTTVVATVVAAPVLALWAAYRGAPLTGEGQDGSSVSASEAGDPGLDGDGTQDHYENAGNARSEPDSRFTVGSRSPDVSVEVISPGDAPTRTGVGPGRLTVDAQPSGGSTLITLTASGGSPVRWSAYEGASWLWLSRTSGELRPGESTTVRVYVDESREPAGAWHARVRIGPGDSVVVIDGRGAGSPSPSDPGRPTSPSPTDPSPTDPTPTDPTPTDPSPTDPSPTDPSPTDPSPTEPSPTDPSPTEPTPTPTDTGSPSPLG
ncbi:BACON domain-containing protein [Streptomyces boluensis]|uniref:BACON domain-containing protein n=1 Tax=Streptomyces boluensis TaxID=1775135 RepID=A0A964XMS4_9ACTN|nr:sigma-70 family RNA polymerase sigma factor [Streptomyces boluensis]NBE54849.1 hypothetical protein [Streptomyces boluensis]